MVQVLTYDIRSYYIKLITNYVLLILWSLGGKLLDDYMSSCGRELGSFHIYNLNILFLKFKNIKTHLNPHSMSESA